MIYSPPLSRLGRSTTLIVLVRHDRTEWNRVERFRGRADIPRDKIGLAQAEATARRIASQWQPVAVYSSALSRAARTAEAIGRQFGLPVQTHRGLTDIDARLRAIPSLAGTRRGLGRL